MRKMKIIAEYGRDDLAKVYVARMPSSDPDSSRCFPWPRKRAKDRERTNW
jgi:hypothetical protein